MKRVASPGSMHDTGCLGLVHWDDPEGWYGEGGRSQKLMLIIRGNAISGAPIIRGTSQLPNPPIIIGITIKKIITNACAVTTTL